MCDSIVAVVACGFYHHYLNFPLKCSDSWKQAYSFAYWHFKRLESYEPFAAHFIKVVVIRPRPLASADSAHVYKELFPSKNWHSFCDRLTCA